MVRCHFVSISHGLQDIAVFLFSTRMWADAQRDGRPAEYRWCPLLNALDQFAKILLWCNLGKKQTASCSQQLQGRRARNLAVTIRKKHSLMHLFHQFFNLQPFFKLHEFKVIPSRGADPGGAGGAAAPPILILVVQTYHFAPPIIPVHK